jgi:hypothetical protein
MSQAVNAVVQVIDMTVAVGARVSVPNKGRGTVKWIGTLEGLESTRVGIELDTPSDSCHSGEYLGKPYFACKPKCGIFLKLEKTNFGKSFLQAIEEKYLKPGEHDSTCERKKGEPKIELVGQEKAERFFTTNVYDLNEISLDGMEISNLGCDQQFSQLEVLSLRENLISNFSDVSRICQLIPSIRELDLSGNKFTRESDFTGSLGLSHLIFNDCSFMNVDVLNGFLKSGHSLRKLSLDRSDLCVSATLSFPTSLTSLSLQGLGLSSWTIVNQIVNQLPNLRHVDLSHNPRLGDIEACDTVNALARLESIAVVDCGITKWSTIRILAEVIPYLTNLHLTENDVYQNSGNGKRQVITFAFPSLTVMNNTAILPAQRAEAERYICTVLGRPKESDSWMWEALPESRRLAITETVSSEPIDEPTVTTTRRRLTVNLSLKMPTGEFLPIKVPCECRSADLHALVLRKSKWPLKPSELQVLISPTTVCEDMISIDTISDINDVGTSDGWYVFTALVENKD